jgi:signal peptidase I
MFWFYELASAHSDCNQEAADIVPSNKRAWSGAATIWTLMLLVAVVIVARYQLFTAGPEMVPTIKNGKAILVRKHIDWASLKPEKLILFRGGVRDSRATAGRLTIARIVAGPGDTICLDGGRYRVNDVPRQKLPRAWGSLASVLIADYPNTTTVPPDRFFVMQDSLSHGLDSTSLSWVAQKDIVSTDFFETEPLRFLARLSESPK